MRVFLGLAKYYHKFVEGYLKIDAPLSDLLKKEKELKLIERSNSTFEEIKYRIVIAPMLKLPYFEKSFEVQNDALEFSIGRVLT